MTTRLPAAQPRTYAVVAGPSLVSTRTQPGEEVVMIDLATVQAPLAAGRIERVATMQDAAIVEDDQIASRKGLPADQPRLGGEPAEQSDGAIGAWNVGLRHVGVGAESIGVADLGDLAVGQIATLVGFSDASAFARAYRRLFGALPSVERRAPTGS